MYDKWFIIISIIIIILLKKAINKVSVQVLNIKGGSVRKRIEELARGKVSVEKPIIEFSVDRIELEALEGKDFAGEFTITGRNKVPVRGMVYSTNSRMECLTPSFEGNEIRIRYEFHSIGLMEGDIQKGDFVVVCNQGEYNLSFVVCISRLYAESEMGKIHGLKDFAKLAKRNWQEAKKIFYAPCFFNVLKEQQVTERLLYRGISKGVPTDRNLEEFLLACKLKEPVLVEAGKGEFAFYSVTETIRQSILITKNTWGHVELDITSDAVFIEPEKDRITSEEFLGSEAEIGFYLYPEKMHAGKNYGCLVLKDMHQEIVISICATFDEEGTVRTSVNREIQRLHAGLMDCYVDYRLKRTVTGKWAFRSIKYLDELIARDSENVWYRLLKAQIYFINGQRQESEWILNEFKRKWKDKKSPEWGYYMYICTLMEHEELYIDRLTEEIQQIYLENKENTILFWCLLFMREDFAQNRYQKLKALEERIMSGTESPLLYVEVYCIYCQEPYLLNQLGDFEWKILNWARKQKMLTVELAEQVISAFSERTGYQRLILLLLEACYELINDERMLTVICGYLIRNQKYGKRFFRWYAKGIEEKLRITGLYEAYLMSMDTRSIQEVPQIIQMYFKYNNQLGYKQKAVLYVNIIAKKNQQSEVYEQYYAAMEKFAYEQMELKRIDDNLAVIYEDVLSHGIYSPQLSEVLADVLFVHKLTCFEREAARVIVIQKQMEKPRIVPLVNGVAYFPLYSNGYSIFIEDHHGNRYSGSVSYQLEKLMYPGKYLRTCMKQAPEKLPYLLHYFSNREAQECFEENTLPYFRVVMASEKVSRAYQAWLFPKMFRLLQKLEETEEMKQQLKRVDLSLMQPKERGTVLEICIEQQLYEEAYGIVEEYGFEQVPVSARVRLCSYKIHDLDFSEDETVVQFCVDTFLIGKYNDAMLEYLSRYYQGPTKVMTAIYYSAKTFGTDIQMLAERILVQMLYTEEYVDNVGAIYESYKLLGNHKLKAAYLTYFSYGSFIKNMVTPQNFFEEVKEWLLEKKALDGICELALLKHYSKHPEILRNQSDEECSEELAEQILKKYILQGMYFAFYQDLPMDLRDRYQLYDKYYIEYHGKKDSRVLFHYKLRESEEDYTVEEMTEVYEGIYVKELVLFLEEAVQYYVIEEAENQIEVTESGLVECKNLPENLPCGRYQRMNEMIRLHAEGELAELAEKMQEYEQLEELVNQNFTVIM